MVLVPEMATMDKDTLISFVSVTSCDFISLHLTSSVKYL